MFEIRAAGTALLIFPEDFNLRPRKWKLGIPDSQIPGLRQIWNLRFPKANLKPFCGSESTQNRSIRDRFHEGRAVQGICPRYLPPRPLIAMDAALERLHGKAQLALGRLDGIVSLLPAPEQFLYAYVRKEAVASSQIEGTQSSLSDLLAYVRMILHPGRL